MEKQKKAVSACGSFAAFYYLCSKINDDCMSQLARHIETLLLEHDSVSVPGLGTFAVSRTPLHNDGKGMFYVPRRDVTFSDNDDNDGVLTAHVARQRRCNADESLALIAQWVANYRMALEECGTCDLGTLGQLVADGDTMKFEPCTAGLSDPAYFGLDNFEMPVLSILTSQIKEAVERSEEDKKSGSRRERHIVIRLNRTLVHYAASIAASILLFFAFSTPTANTDVQQATVIPSFFMPAATVDDMNGGDAALEQIQAEEAEAQEAADKVQANTEVQPEGFAVVVASSIRQKNAEAMVQRLHAKGFDQAQVFVHKGMVRVAFLGYSDRQTAATAAANMRGKDSELSGAWVFEIK